MTPLEEIAAAVERYRQALAAIDGKSPNLGTLLRHRDEAQADLERIAGSALMATAVVDLNAKLDALRESLADLGHEHRNHWHGMFSEQETGGPRHE